LLFLTLGFYTPYFDMRRQTFLIEKSYYGNAKFDFDGQGKDLFGSYVLAVLLAIPPSLFPCSGTTTKKPFMHGITQNSEKRVFSAALLSAVSSDCIWLTR